MSQLVLDFDKSWPDKVDGSYLESQTGGDAVWNWRPAA